MSALDCRLGGAYRLYAIDNDSAGASAGMKAMLAADSALAASAQVRLSQLTPDVQGRDYISKVHAAILAAALAA